MPHLRLTVSAELRAAVERASRARRISMHTWVIFSLNAAAGIGSIDARSIEYTAQLLIKDHPRPRISLRIQDDLWDEYILAAGAAALPVVDWCRAVLGVAAGISVLDVQLKRLR